MSELLRKIAGGEGEQLDFKFRIDDQKKIARTLAAFANTNGGSLLIGVKDNGKVAGVNPEEEFYMIEGAASMYTNPQVSFDSRVWQEGHYLVLEIVVPKSMQKHKAKDEDSRWRSYTRVDDHTLMGNKILDRVWKLSEQGLSRPEAFDESTSEMLNCIRKNGPLSLSKLYRSLSLNKQTVDKLLSTLVYWEVVEMEMDESGTRYRVEG